MVHESYANRGGEDEVVDSECDALSARGHEVVRWSVSNAQILGWSNARKASLAWRTTWSTASRRTLSQLIQSHAPDLVHFHNTLPIITPSAIRVAHSAGLPVVMTLHNYRLMCPAATFVREGRVCEDCHLHSLLRGVLHGCYRESTIQTAAVALMLAVHRRMGTWTDCVDAYIALSAFMRAKVVEGGLSATKVHVRANPVRRSGQRCAEPIPYAIFVGRLSEEKGISCLLEASRRIPAVTLKVVGDGPLASSVRKESERANNPIEYLGRLPHQETLAAIANARVLLCPSICYEGLPLTLIEALANGVPVVASRLGSMAEMITDGIDGFLYDPGDARQLAECTSRLMTDDLLRERMSRAAEATYEARFSGDRAYEKLIDVYNLAIASSASRRFGRTAHA
jgi:glycosyltransferase involved in cell wall biosynthesis